MTNRNYVSGRNFEYRVKAYLEKRGYKVLRSAGSHSPIDLIAGKDPLPRLAVQCKNYHARFSPEDADTLIEWADAFDAIPILAANLKTRIVTSRVTEKGVSPLAV